jgi:hypothetical protein
VVACGEAASERIRAGDDREREQIWAAFDALPERSPLRAMVIDAFLDWHLARMLEELDVAAGTPPELPPLPADLDMPGQVKDAPERLQQAWRLFQQATRGPAAARPAKDEGIAFQTHEPAFQRVVEGLLRGRVAPADAVSELTRFEWGGWCGTGSDALYRPQAKALMIAHARLGRLDQAVLANRGLAGWLRPVDDPAPWDHRLLAAAGLDWERFYLGGLLSGELQFAEGLARAGSDDAARDLVTAVRLVLAHEDESAARGLLEPLGALVTPGGSCTAYATLRWPETKRDPEAPALSPGVEEAALELLHGLLGAETGLEEAEEASQVLVQLCRPESREAFAAMLASPYNKVRKRGALALRALGER